ncbi:DNA-directed RNA polymerase sigma-70 factor [Sphaerisporangium rufum]|uniref:DNA-directed RNA polymerase sigma-70 factor n=1 Tax=Sphaerisporangium rufum TaxID=1381558 RepID=A0A919RAT1_9ACTN|nr:SigE family RNA polymerase sigma factor [Sphaerisporangium rufum]GII81556.1 DNA-directed RNA polymerase sigma-70 factor [Sphaerisporangium rufum]
MDDVPDFAEFAADRIDALFRYAYMLSGNPHDAADLVQEAMLRLRGSWSRVRRKDDPESYVKTTITRLHISVWRRRRREHLAWEVPERPQPVAESPLDLWDDLARLPKRQRAVLVLRYYQDLPDAEIAEILGISPATVRSQAHRALGKLRDTVTPLRKVR